MTNKTYFAAGMTAVLALGGIANADTIAQWTFENGALGAAVNNLTGITRATLPTIAADTTAAGVTAVLSGAHASAGSKWYTGSGYLASVTGLYSTGWAQNDYYQLNVSSLSNYSDISLSFAQTGSNSGPADFKIQYSLDGTTFVDASVPVLEANTDAGSNSNAISATTTGSFVIPNGDATANTPIGSAAISLATTSKKYQGEILWTVDLSSLSNVAAIRIVEDGTDAIVGGTAASGGTNRIDDITFSGTANAAVPEPASLGLLALGAMGMIARRRRA